MKIINLRLIVLFMLISCSYLIAKPVNANLLGDTVVVNAPGIPGNVTTVEVVDEIELIFNDEVGFGTGVDEYITVDIDSTMISISLYAKDYFWGWQPGIPDDPFTISFSDLTWIDLNYVLDAITFYSSGYFASGLSALLVGPNSVDVLVPLSSHGASCDGTFCGRIDISLSGVNAPIEQSVPEPTTIALMALGLAFIGIYRVRSNSK